jgi:DNA modification methylase
MGGSEAPPDRPESRRVRCDAYAELMAARRTRSLAIGDNLEVLAGIPDGSVALVYLDPPFNSGRTYDLVDAKRGMTADGRVAAFRDRWGWGEASEEALRALPSIVPQPLADLVDAVCKSLGRRDMSAYLIEMAPRLMELHRVLDAEGALYLHCDAAASHYLRLLLDAIFGLSNFRNEIVWRRTHAHSSSRRFGPVHDTILFYSKGARYRWNSMYTAYPKHYIDKYYTHQDEQGRFQLITCTAPGDREGTRAHYRWKGNFPPPGRHWAWKRETMESFEQDGKLVHSTNSVPRLKRYVDEAPGVQLQDVWSDINRLDAHSEERVGFETQKPLSLLERIIEASTDPGDTVLDPFVGSGTTLVASERAGRGWIGIDTSLLGASLSLARVRQEVNLWRVNVDGFPADRKSALKLLHDEPQAFGLWGTSMLATLADRKGRDESIVVGTGEMRIKRKLTQLKSWVPLGSMKQEGSWELPRGRLSKRGFVLRADRSIGAGLTSHLKSELEMPIDEVPLESLVSKDSRQRGLAREVVALGSP